MQGWRGAFHWRDMEDIEDEGGAWPTGAKGVRKIQSGCQ